MGSTSPPIYDAPDLLYGEATCWSDRPLLAAVLLWRPWTCFEKVESSLEVKGELDDEATTVYKGI